MRYFFDTVETIPEGVGFALFGPCHLLWLAGFAVFTVLCCLVYRRQAPAGRRRMRLVMAALLIADECFKHVCLLTHGEFLPKYLPLHLCSINILLIAIHAVRPSKALDNFLYAICIPGALAALLFPAWTPLPAANFMHIHSATVHILLAAYPIMLTAGGDIRPALWELPRPLLLLAALAAVAYGANLVFGTNFMFLMYAEAGNPLMWFEKTFGSYLVGFPVLGAAVILVMYTPVLLHTRRKGKQDAKGHRLAAR